MQSCFTVFYLAACAALALAAPAEAQTGEIVGQSELRICADPNNLPFS